MFGGGNLPADLVTVSKSAGCSKLAEIPPPAGRFADSH